MAAVADWDNRALKRFLKDRGVNVKHFKERSLLVEHVQAVIQAEAGEERLRQLAVVAVVLLISFLLLRLARKHRATLRNAFHLNPRWLVLWALQWVLSILLYLNIISVISSWILPAKWNLARVYFWDHLLPDFSIPIPAMGSGGGVGGSGGSYAHHQQQQQRPSMGGLNIMPMVAGWAIRRAQQAVFIRMIRVPVYRNGYIPPAALGESSYDSSDDDDGTDDDAPLPPKQEPDDDVVFLSDNHALPQRARRQSDDDEMFLRHRRPTTGSGSGSREAATGAGVFVDDDDDSGDDSHSDDDDDDDAVDRID